MIDLNGKNVLVLGGSGFLGGHTCRVLSSKNAIVTKHSKKDCDLTDLSATRMYFKEVKPELVLGLAGFNGGIQFNRTFPANIFYLNTIMNLNVIKVSEEVGVEKLLGILTSCAYPDNIPLLKEEMLYDGLPNPSISCHGLAKRNTAAYSEFMRIQENFNVCNLIVTNLLGPHDVFGGRGKVVSNLIKKFVEAKQSNTDEIVCWGKGQARRDLLYVEDAAGLIVDALEKLDHDHLLNIGSGSDISIKDLTELVAKLVGYAGKVVWDGRDDGQLVKLLDTTKMNEVLTYRPKWSLEEGLRETIQWYINNKESADQRL